MSAIFAHSDPNVFRVAIANEFSYLFSKEEGEENINDSLLHIVENIEKGIPVAAQP